MPPQTPGCNNVRRGSRVSPRLPAVARPPAPAADREVEQVEQLRAMTADQLRHEVVTLRRALASNRRIGAAVGVVMHERGLGYDDAFAVLRRMSQDTNVPLVEVADAVLHLGHLWC